MPFSKFMKFGNLFTLDSIMTFPVKTYFTQVVYYLCGVQSATQINTDLLTKFTKFEFSLD